MERVKFDPSILNHHDRMLAELILGDGGRIYKPDLVISLCGEPYLFRWYVVPCNPEANVYFHIQVASDPERPLHDHPWDNTSVILAGGYQEILNKVPAYFFKHGQMHRIEAEQLVRRPGDVIYREATWAHRLILPENIPYTLTLFTAGPMLRKWGFWFADGWRPYDEVTEVREDGSAVFKI